MRYSSVLLLCALGCASAASVYHMDVEAYNGGASMTIAPGSRLTVISNPNAPNPLLDQEAAAKVGRVFAQRGFRLVPVDSADYAVFLEYGIGSRAVSGTALEYLPGSTTTIANSRGATVATVKSSGELVTRPTVYAVHDRWLRLIAVDVAHYRQTNQLKQVWIGETKSTGTNSDLRHVLDYLILPTASTIGRNVPQTRYELSEGDARVRALSSP